MYAEDDDADDDEQEKAEDAPESEDFEDEWPARSRPVSQVRCAFH